MSQSARVLALVSEESLPPEELPSPGATPSPAVASTPASPSRADWKRVPNPADTPAEGNQHGENTTLGAATSPAVAPPEGLSPAAPSTMPSQTPDTSAQGVEVPPALDLGTLNTGPDLSNVSLEPEIKRADSPARAASLRLTEDARKELASGKAADALRNLGRAVSIDPADPFEYFYLGRTYVAKQNCAQALTFLKRAEIGFASRPDWLGQTIGLEGACYEEMGSMNEASDAYRRALTHAPNNLAARIGYSRLAGSVAPVGTLDAPPPMVQEAGPPPSGPANDNPPEEAPPPPPPSERGDQQAE
jgi:hypothetical protein